MKLNPSQSELDTVKRGDRLIVLGSNAECTYRHDGFVLFNKMKKDGSVGKLNHGFIFSDYWDEWGHCGDTIWKRK